MFTSVETLLELATMLSSMKICQCKIFGLDQNRNFLFGIDNADWPSIIVKMFMRKLIKLEIGTSYEQYISKSGAITLIQVQFEPESQ